MESVLRLSGFTEIYERLLVPSIFAPWAQDLIARARPIGPSDRILDLGCGTGIVARLIRDRLGAAARITGVDASSEMIAAARTVAPDLDWRIGNAMELPFADASFELVISQQMLQFVPDRVAAVREIRRVLVPGGRVVVATWRSRAESPLFDQLGTIVDRHLGPRKDPRYALGDRDELERLFSDAGFTGIEIDAVSRVDHYKEMTVRLAVAPLLNLPELEAGERDARIAAIEAEGAPILQQFVGPGGFAAESRANFLTARAP